MVIKPLNLFFLILLLFPKIACAASWYVIPGSAIYGTTSTTCNGNTDVSYTTGNGPNCAVSSLYDILQWTSDDGSTTRGTQRISGGDTIILDDNGTHWPIGADRTTTPGNCTSAISYGCYFLPIPSGTDSSHPTKIYGKNWNTGCASKAQLYATQGVKRIFDLSASSHVDLECLELTDHSNCMFRVGTPQCNETYGTDIGVYGRVAIYANVGTDFTFKNIDCHGMGDRCFNISQLTGPGVWDHVNADASANAGLDADVGGTTAWSGTFTYNYRKTRFNGCSEAYPRSATFSTSDYSNCTDQNGGGYGDGDGYNTTGGDFNITNSEWSHNVQDGLDMLYHSSGNIKIDKSLFEGNDGNQLKFTGQNVEVDNSHLIANCDYFTQTSKIFNTGSWSDCRANGTPISATPLLGGNWKFFNNTSITSTGSGGSAFIEVTDRYFTANGTENYTYSNNVLYSYNNTWTAYYNGLSGGASTAWNAAVTDHSDIYNFTSAPSGTGVVTTNPQFLHALSLTADSNVANVYLTGSSPGKGNGSTNTFWNNNKDFNIFAQNSPIDQGALQLNSSLQLIASGSACIANSDCVSNSCSNFLCASILPTQTVLLGSLKLNGSIKFR